MEGLTLVRTASLSPHFLPLWLSNQVLHFTLCSWPHSRPELSRALGLNPITWHHFPSPPPAPRTHTPTTPSPLSELLRWCDTSSDFRREPQLPRSLSLKTHR